MVKLYADRLPQHLRPMAAPQSEGDLQDAPQETPHALRMRA